MDMMMMITAAAASKLENVAVGPADMLGVGEHPGSAAEAARRDTYARRAAHVAGPLARKASRANTARKAARLVRAAGRVDSSLANALAEVLGA